ncbi:MAG TPA: transcription elongation factor Spt5 [Euryarchaeota archaeon]|nr:transcription elongation factor Spt5 [Euryarchaeota archaeon]
MSPSISGENGLQKVHAGGKVVWPFSVSADASEVKISFSVIAGPDAENAPEWNVTLYDNANGELWSNYRSKSEVSVDLPGRSPKEFVLEVICPKGARFGDTVETEVFADDGTGTDSMNFKAIASQSIMVLKTQIDQERSVADTLYLKAVAEAQSNSTKPKDIYAILSPAGLRGYVFVEGMNTDRLREKTRDIKKARSFIDGETDIEEVGPYLIPMSAVVGIVEGDIVELVNGPFKGEKARVQQIDPAKEEITVELIEAMVPIPVTVKGDSVRVIEKER